MNDIGRGSVLSILRLDPRARLPEYMTSGAAGLDLSAVLDGDLALAPGARALVPTGLAIAIAEGYEGQVRPRSGLALKTGITVLNAPGTIDSDYRGALQVILVNLGSAEHVLRTGDRIAQLVIAPVARVRVSEVASLEDTARGTGGFGHTGHR